MLILIVQIKRIFKLIYTSCKIFPVGFLSGSIRKGFFATKTLNFKISLNRIRLKFNYFSLFDL